MTHRTCSITDCSKPTRTPAAGLCSAHYMKWYRHGDPEYKPSWPHRDLAGQTFGNLTPISIKGGVWHCQCSCGNTRSARSYELLNGLALACSDKAVHARQEVVQYDSAHGRLRTDRGKASDHRCVDCGSAAQHWSYNHDDPDELTSTRGPSFGLQYSLKQDSYSPRCVPCHKTYDLEVIAYRR